MRFLLDQDVDVAVRRMLIATGHECWTAADAGLTVAADDDLTVYAQAQGAILVTHDAAFSRRRRANCIGHHLWLKCAEMDAAELLRVRLDEVVAQFVGRANVTARLSPDELVAWSQWK
ncbi:MAG TPA: DUF5615 family PIN-like protein [Actinomycetes bacterium]|nr:DUF5615 family PIN-like protein [Actinomycetes bacterium]